VAGRDRRLNRGINSLMSVTVSQRTREIGIRMALGANARQVIGAILSRALAQLGLGVLAGGAAAFLDDQIARASDPRGRGRSDAPGGPRLVRRPCRARAADSTRRGVRQRAP
jgi:hypothetical protein